MDYGADTPSIRKIVNTMRSFQIFARLPIGPQSRLRAALREHLRRVQAWVGAPLVEGIDIRILPFVDLMTRLEQANERTWVDVLGKRFQVVLDSVDESTRHLVGPPLWPVPGMINVVQPIATRNTSQVLRNIPSEFGQRCWEIACAVDQWTWNAIQWEIILHGALQTNPFYPLLKLAVLGVVPIGVQNAQLVAVGALDEA